MPKSVRSSETLRRSSNNSKPCRSEMGEQTVAPGWEPCEGNSKSIARKILSLRWRLSLRMSQRGLRNTVAERVAVECCRKHPRRERHIFSVSTESSAVRCFDLAMSAGRTSQLITRLIRATSFAAAELPFRLAQNALMAGWLSAKASGESSSAVSNILTAQEGRLYLRERDAVESDRQT